MRTHVLHRTRALGCALALLVASLVPGCSVAPARPPAPGEIQAATVTRVVDGDTIHVVLADGRMEKVRVIGIDAPEDTERHDPYGGEATAYARRELNDRRVWLETDAELRDRYGRLLAYVWLEAPPAEAGASDVRAYMFEARMLADGYATLLTVPPNVRYVDALRPLEAEARQAGRGLWGLPSR